MLVHGYCFSVISVLLAWRNVSKNTIDSVEVERFAVKLPSVGMSLTAAVVCLVLIAIAAIVCCLPAAPVR